MSDSAFFKVKSSKRSNPEARTTLDAIHNQKVQNMIDQKENINAYKDKLEQLKKKISETTWKERRSSGTQLCLLAALFLTAISLQGQ